MIPATVEPKLTLTSGIIEHRPLTFCHETAYVAVINGRTKPLPIAVRIVLGIRL